MANALTLSNQSGQMPMSSSMRHRLSVTLTDYTTGGEDLTTLLDAALKPSGLTASQIVDGFASLKNDAEGLKRVADFDPTTRKLTLKKQGGAGDLVQESNGAIGATVTLDLTVFID